MELTVTAPELSKPSELAGCKQICILRRQLRSCKDQFKALYRQAYIQGYEKGYNGQGSGEGSDK